MEEQKIYTVRNRDVKTVPRKGGKGILIVFLDLPTSISNTLVAAAGI
jgi:hypothetical protein